MAWEHFIEKVPWTSILKKVRMKTMEQLGRRFFRELVTWYKCLEAHAGEAGSQHGRRGQEAAIGVVGGAG